MEELNNKVEGMNVGKEQIDRVARALARKVVSLESNLEEKKEIQGLGATNEVKIKAILKKNFLFFLSVVLHVKKENIKDAHAQ